MKKSEISMTVNGQLDEENVRTIFEALGESLDSFWTTAKDEQQWESIAREAGSLGFLILFHKGIKNLSFCQGSDHGDSPVLFCPEDTNIRSHVSVDAEMYRMMLRLEIERRKKQKKAHSEEHYRRYRIWPRNKRYTDDIVSILMQGNPPEIFKFLIMTDHRHEKEPFFGYVDDSFGDLAEARRAMTTLKEQHPGSMFEVHAFSVGKRYICACI